MYSEDWMEDADPQELWSLIELARRDLEGFRGSLERKDRHGLIRLAWLFEDFASRLADSPYVDRFDPSLSEDTIDDLCEEVVGRGRDFYEDVLANPSLMPKVPHPSDASHRIRRALSDLFHARYGEEIPPYSYDD